MSTWSPSWEEGSSYHTQAMKRFASLFDDPLSIIYWGFSEQLVLILSIAAGIAFTVSVVYDHRANASANVDIDKIQPSSFITKYVVILASFAMPYLMSF